MDLERLSAGEKIAAAASALLLVLSFVPLWAKYEVVGSVTARTNAWSAAFNAFPKLALFLLLIALGLILARSLNAEPPRMSSGSVYLALTGAAALLLLIAALIGPDELGYEQTAGVFHVSRGPLLLIGWLIAAAAAFGAYAHRQQEASETALGPPPPSTGR